MDYQTFITDSKTTDTVVRNFEIIGEAANHIPEGFKLKHREIKWRQIIDFRNRIIHEYFGVDYQIVWNIKEQFLPDFIDWLDHLSEKLQ